MDRNATVLALGVLSVVGLAIALYAVQEVGKLETRMEIDTGEAKSVPLAASPDEARLALMSDQLAAAKADVAALNEAIEMMRLVNDEREKERTFAPDSSVAGRNGVDSSEPIQAAPESAALGLAGPSDARFESIQRRFALEVAPRETGETSYSDFQPVVLELAEQDVPLTNGECRETICSFEFVTHSSDQTLDVASRMQTGVDGWAGGGAFASEFDPQTRKFRTHVFVFRNVGT